jgi:hypothetical protein
MAISRKKALERLTDLTPHVEEHMAKMAADPENPAFSHWAHEVKNWLSQMEKLIPVVGKKTGAIWAEQIEVWRSRLEG